MFVADSLLDGIETFPGIIAMLNDRRIGRWRNAVTKDFTAQEVLLTLKELAESGSVDAWRNSGGTAVSANLDSTCIVRLAREDPDCLWFRLTEKGREAMQAWDPPKTFEDMLIEYLRASDTQVVSLNSTYRWLSEQTNEDLPFAEFASLVSYMVDYDYARLRKWHDDDKDGQMARVSALPPNLEVEYATRESTDSGASADPLGYYLTLGDKGSLIQVEEKEPLAGIQDTSVLLEELVKRSPHLLPWFTERKTVRHIIVYGDSVTIGTGSMLDFVNKVRWGKGLPGIENVKIRHLVLDEAGTIVGDYYGVASSDPLSVT